MQQKKIIVEILIFLGLAFILNLFNIRFCPFFNTFKIPCPGCGLTRAVVYFLKGNIIKSFQYNILGIPIIVLLSIYIVLFLFHKTDVIDYFLKKNKTTVIVIAIILMVVVMVINIHNPRLY